MGTVRNARVNQGGPKCAGIVGLGLIGGSFARGYAQAGVRVLAWACASSHSMQASG